MLKYLYLTNCDCIPTIQQNMDIMNSILQISYVIVTVAKMTHGASWGIMMAQQIPSKDLNVKKI